MTDAAFRKRFYWTVAVFSAALMTAVFASIKGWIPPRLFAWLLIALVVVGYVAFYRLLKRASDDRRIAGELDQPLDEATRRRYRSSILRMKIMVGVLVFALLFGLWSERQGPLFPQIVGASVNILLNVGLISSIRKMQHKLR